MENQDQNQKIKMYSVHSSNVSKLGWYFCEQSKQGVMVVEFLKGTRYMYFPVENTKLREALDSDAAGKWVQANLVQNKEITCQKIGQPKLGL